MENSNRQALTWWDMIILAQTRAENTRSAMYRAFFASLWILIIGAVNVTRDNTAITDRLILGATVSIIAFMIMTIINRRTIHRYREDMYETLGVRLNGQERYELALWLRTGATPQTAKLRDKRSAYLEFMHNLVRSERKDTGKRDWPAAAIVTLVYVALIVMLVKGSTAVNSWHVILFVPLTFLIVWLLSPGLRAKRNRNMEDMFERRRKELK